MSVDGTQRRTVDLYDKDEWRWALIARGLYFETPEILKTSEGQVQVSFPLPKQLESALSLLGTNVGGWQWNVYNGAPLLEDFIR